MELLCKGELQTRKIISPNYSGSLKNYLAELIPILPPVFYSEIVFKDIKLRKYFICMEMKL